MPRRQSWIERWLPALAVRDWLEPALHDLDAERARRGVSRSKAVRAATRAWFAVRALLLYGDCIRLFLVERVRPLPPAPFGSADPSSVPREDFAAMVIRDLRHSLRLFRREPGFTAAAVLTLALGLGANVALFAVVEAVLLRPLPFSGSDELVMLRYRDTRTGFSKDFVALGDVIDLQARAKGLETLAAYNGVQSTLLDQGEPVRVQGIAATPQVFAALRVTPALGRVFGPEDVREGGQPVVIISHNLWTTRFGTDPAIVGRSIQLGAARRLVVGVAPRGFAFPPAAVTDVVVPMRMPSAAPAERHSWIHAMGRLRAGISVQQANAELAALSRQLEAEFPASNRGLLYDVLTLRDAALGDTGRPLRLLFVAVGFVLLIACVNVGNLLIARALARQQELSTRLALGAGRFQLAMQMLIEGVVLSLAGAIVGVVVAWRTAPALAAMVPQATPIPGLDAVAVNPVVLAFAFGTSVVAALLFSTMAALGLRGSTAAVATSRRSTMSGAARRAASALVVGELAVAVVLLIGAGLTLRSFSRLVSIDPGFSPDRVINVQIGLPPGRYADAGSRRDVYERMFAAMRAVPGVETVGAAVVTPLTGNNWTLPLERPEHPLGQDERPPEVGWQLASGDYFKALKIPLRAGRLFQPSDRPDTPPVVIVSEGLATRYFAGENPVGRRVTLGPKQTAEIVGVVGDIRRAALSDELRADMYLSFEQASNPSMGIFVRTSGDPLEALPALRTSLRTVEPSAVVFDAQTLEEVAAQSAAVARLAMRLLALFAAVALALAATGIYGVMSYSVRRRTREMGTRLALGATRGDIVALVLRQAAAVTAIGIFLGVVVGLAAARSLGSILFGVPPWDPMSIAAAIAILALASLTASYVPARRAARIDPARTLATE